jgi:hypothetical protein
MNISLQHTLHQRDLQTEKLGKQIDTLIKAIAGEKVDVDQGEEEFERPDSPSPSVMMDPTEMSPPTFVFSPPEDNDLSSPEPTNMRSPSRSPSPFSTRRPLEGSLSNDT